MKRKRFEAVQPGYVFQSKDERYVKFNKPVKLSASLTFNAVDSHGGLLFFLPYTEVSEVGPLLTEKK